MSPIVNENLSETLLNLPTKLTNLSMPSTSPSTLRLPDHASPLPSGKPYILASDQGETITLVGSGSAMRYLATARETDDQFAVVHTRARADVPVPAHFHARTHDTFLCVRGTMKVWQDDQCRVLGPGDFASVPPRCVHAFQPLSPENEFIGIISPGSWTKMFNFIGEPFTDSPTFPWNDGRPFPVPLFIEAIKAGEDVVPQREYGYPEAIGMSESDTPSPTYTHARSEAAQGLFEGGRVKLASHTLFRCIEGKIRFALEEAEEEVSAGESVMVPAGRAFSYVVTSAYARMYCFSGKGGGLEEVFVSVGSLGENGEVVGANEDVVTSEAVKAAVKALGGEVV
ncbi:hypothetical protein QFC20_002867 [Naganishia adeliensis]|uniref:Uncharacterized protein n=1 Tax=Naganishia adeliensis TaxID=92952 RepID=A0ACC2WH70_9TREE|nr:hypothetical protein QFC20_002867 [Naganishia adeliensis]